MKFFAPWILVFALAAGRVEAGDFIRQIQTIAGVNVISDIPISGDSGTANSLTLLSETVTFQLYTTVTDANNVSKLLKLDEKTTGTFLPNVTATILSDDPHVPARTRADKPYGVQVEVKGMQTGLLVPAYAKSVQMIRSYVLYDPVSYGPTTSKGEYLDTLTFLENNKYLYSGILQRLPVARPTKAAGEESVTLYSQTILGTAAGQLAKATIKIWPVATAEISGIEKDKVYTQVPSTGTVMVKDIYPGAKIYAQIYKGPAVLGTVGTVLPSTVVAYSDTTEVPQNQALVLNDLETTLKADGEYTLEVLTITPFNGGAPERLAFVSFKIKRSVIVNGTITTME